MINRETRLATVDTEKLYDRETTASNHCLARFYPTDGPPILRLAIHLGGNRLVPNKSIPYMYMYILGWCFMEASFIWVFSQSKVFRESPRTFDIVVAVLSLHLFIFTQFTIHCIIREFPVRFISH